MRKPSVQGLSIEVTGGGGWAWDALTPPLEHTLDHDESRKNDVFAIIFIAISIMIKMLAIYL